MTTTWGFAQEFLPKFQIQCTDLNARVQSATAPNPDLAVELIKITKSLHDATGSLTTYDQRQCELNLKDIETSLEALRLRAKPKSKFAFKRPTLPNSPSTNTTISELEPIANFVQVKEPSSHLKLSSHQRTYLDSSALPPRSAEQSADLTISDLEGCIVNLISNTTQIFSAVHIQNVRDTILLLPVITGSVLIHNNERCTIVLGCHQLRMHDSSWVDVYLHISSTPVIENTSHAQFTTYPTTLLPSSQPSPVFAVQDFSHVRPTPSPNWRPMPEENANLSWPINRVGDSVLQEVLAKILPNQS